MEKKITNWGIIGLGKIAHKFARDLLLVPGARLSAVASQSQERSDQFAAQYHARFAYGSYETILDCPELDAVYIATPHVSHAALSIQCLERKIPVLCEKPFAMNAREVRRMIAAAKAKDTFLMEAMWTRFFPLIEKTFEIVKSGAIGDLLTLKADFGFHAPQEPDSRIYSKKLGGGAILDVGIYPLVLSLWLFGKPEKIRTMTTFTHTGVDESCSILLDYSGNRMANLYASLKTQTEVEATLYGTKGKLRLYDPFHHPRQLSHGLYYQDTQTLRHNYPGNGYQFEITEVMDCLQKGLKESPKMPLDFSLQLIELLDDVRVSAGMHYEQDDAD